MTENFIVFDLNKGTLFHFLLGPSTSYWAKETSESFQIYHRAYNRRKNHTKSGVKTEIGSGCHTARKVGGQE